MKFNKTAGRQAMSAPSGVPGVSPKNGQNPALLTLPGAARRITQADIIRAAAILKKYKDGKQNLERRLVEDELWYQLRHQEVLRRGKTSAKDDAGRPIEEVSPTSGWLFNVITNKHADAMDNYPQPVVLPREASDESDAKMLSDILPVIQERNEYEQTYSDNQTEKDKHGTGVYGVFWNNDLENGLGDIDIKRIDLLNIFWQPGIENIQDSRNLFIVQLVDDDLLAQEYPEETHGGKLGDVIDVTKYVYDDYVDTSEKTLVVDWYYKVRNASGNKVVQYCKFAGNTELFSSENYQDPETGEYIYAERGYYDHGMYPVVFDPLYKEKGTPVGFGFVSVCKDPQLYIDRLGGCILENAIVGSKSRYYMRTDCGINEEEFKDIRNTIVHVEGSISDEKLLPIAHSELSGNYIAVYQSKVDELKETSSNRDFSNGSTASGVTAAAAIAALQEAGNKQSRDSNSASYRCDKKISIMVIELIRQFYNEERCFRITGHTSDGQEQGFQFVQYSNANIKDQEIPNPAGGEPFIRRPIFDIKVKAQKRNPYSQLSQNEQAKELYKLGAFNPEQAQPAMLMLGMMEFEGIDKVREQIQQGQTLMNLLQQATEQRDKLYVTLMSLTGQTPDAVAMGGGGAALQGGGAPKASSATPLESAAKNAQQFTQTPYAQTLAEHSRASTKPEG